MKGLMSFILILVVIVLAAFNFSILSGYFAQAPTGNVVVEETPHEEETTDLFTQILTPTNLDMTAVIGEDTRETFEITNLYDESIEVGCFFSDFQEGVPASSCYTYDANGRFVGEGTVAVSPGRTQRFTIRVRPYNDVRIQKGTTNAVITIQPGEYKREVRLTAIAGESGLVSEKRIPIMVTVER